MPWLPWSPDSQAPEQACYARAFLVWCAQQPPTSPARTDAFE